MCHILGSVDVKIAACVGVKDEVELIRACVGHLRRIGVDHIIVSDAYSTDGTADVLAELAQGGTLEVVMFDDQSADPSVEDSATRDIFRRARNVGADWLLFCDADEFPMPRTGQLRDVKALSRSDALIISRFNVPLLQDGIALNLETEIDYDATLLYAPNEDRTATQARLRQDNDAPWIASIPGPKLMARTDRISSTAEAHHNILAEDGAAVTTEVPNDLFLAHVPFSTESRFYKKVENIRSVLTANGENWGPDSAWHWRRWIDNIEKRGGISGELARNIVTDQELSDLRRLGIVKSAVEVWEYLAVSHPR